MIEVTNLTKRYGTFTVVDDLHFSVRPGTVTGFLGPNGAGKSTTMRMILGLDRPTGGSAKVNGRRLIDVPAPITELGALLEARAVHPRRSARNHLLALARTTGIAARRVDDALDIVGLDHFVIIGKGRLIADVTAAELEAMAPEATVVVRSDDNGRLRSHLDTDGVTVSDVGDVLTVTGIDATTVGRIAHDADVVLSELHSTRRPLEQTFMDLTADAVEYSANTTPAAA